MNLSVRSVSPKFLGIFAFASLGLVACSGSALDVDLGAGKGDPQLVSTADDGSPEGTDGGAPVQGEAEPVASSDGGAAIPPPEPCPEGLGDRWTCDGQRRIRCVDGWVDAVTCEAGCTAGVNDEAVCSCGTRARYSRWNCMPDGTRASCAGGIAWVVDSCGGKGCSGAENGTSDQCANAGALQYAVASLGASCASLVPGIQCSIAVRDLVTNERAGYGENRFYVSASSAKAFWVAAALHDRTVAAVEPYVHAVFEKSDNAASGRVIDLLASPERVNTFQWQDAQLADVGFCAWDTDRVREPRNCPGVMNGDNFFTTSDAVSFLEQVWNHSLLGADKSNTLLSWMQLSPRKGYGGWLGTQLPEAARATMHHKAGWLPPAAVAGYSNANEIGIVEVPGGHAYAVAFALKGAKTQAAYDNQELPLLEYLSCRVYHAVAGDDASVCKAP